MDLDGSNSRSIETGGRIFRGNLEVSETHLYFNTQASGSFETFRVPIAGGARERLFTDPASVPPGFTFRSLSPDGRRAAGSYRGPDGAGLAVVSIDGSARTVEIPSTYTPGIGALHRLGAGGAGARRPRGQGRDDQHLALPARRLGAADPDHVHVRARH